MTSVITRTSGMLPFTCEQAFDLAADIEHYPEFLKGWISARIQSRESNICCVDQVIGIGPLRLQFMSRAILHRPVRIEVTSTQVPFRLFSLSWLIAAAQPAGCRVSVVANIELQSRITQWMVDGILPAMIDDLITAFEARAHRLYPSANPVGTP
jgi:coenzyme Q-binding protein COQ10